MYRVQGVYCRQALLVLNLNNMSSNEDQHHHHRKKNSQVIINPAVTYIRQQQPLIIPTQNNTLLFQPANIKENLLNRNNMRTQEQDKSHKRQTSLLGNNVQFTMHPPNVGQQPLAPSNAMNFKALAKQINPQPTFSNLMAMATTPTNNASNYNPQLSRVREKRPEERPSRLPEPVNYLHKKLELKEESVVRDNTKEKARPSFNNDKNRKKKRHTEEDQFQCNEELEITQPIKSVRPNYPTPTATRPTYELHNTPTSINNPIPGGFGSTLGNPLVSGLNGLLSHTTLQPPSLHIQPPSRNYQDQLKQFESRQTSYIMQQQVSTIVYLTNRQLAYAPDPYYIKHIERRQKHFSWEKRAILMAWMMEATCEFKAKRETFHIAVMLTDMYFNRTKDLPQSEFQLVGYTALFLASKMEQPMPVDIFRIREQSTNIYRQDDILNMEIKILKTLKWQLNPPTINMWAGRIMQQWDIYLQQNQEAKSHPLLRMRQPVFFKKVDEISFKHYSQVMQLIDCSLLEIQTLQYKPKILVLSFMYLILGKQFGEFRVKDIITEFPGSSLYLFNEKNLFNDLFSSFVEFSFGIMLFDLLPTIQYCATYFILPFVYNPPDLGDEQSVNMEDYVTYQTYNPHSLSVMKRRNRGLSAAVD